MKTNDFNNFHKRCAFHQRRWMRKLEVSSEKTERLYRTEKQRDWTKKESTTFSNQDIKGSIFPESRAKPLKRGQLLAAQFNQKIKHRGSSRLLYRELLRNHNLLSLDSSLFPKRVSANSCQIGGQITFP